MIGSERLVQAFRRQMRTSAVARVVLIAALVAGLTWAAMRPDPQGRQYMFLISLGALLSWVAITLGMVRQTQEVQASTILLATGQLDRAETWLEKCLERFSFSRQVKLAAMQQLAVLYLRRGQPDSVIALCREVLRYPIMRWRQIWVNARLMLADSLLELGHIAEAYESLQPIYAGPLSLSERMKLLPVQLRYELASDHADSAVRELRQKVELAELFPSAQAALVHALLAEACRREGLAAQSEFLRGRALLYHDLEALVKRYPILAPLDPDSARGQGEEEGETGREGEGETGLDASADTDA